LLFTVFIMMLLTVIGITPLHKVVAQTPEATSVPTVTTNNQWKPQLSMVQGVEMALVPPGCFMMGSEKGNDDEQPVSKICFDKPFWIDKVDVTNAQFKQFGGKAQQKGSWKDDNRPRERVTWFEARDFCALRGARLPTEAEWEYAARG